MTVAADPADLIQMTTRRQRDAANPAISAFVSANAGSGKTRVLTNRVARLLLAGAEPQRILCITFTKAAAAEMAARLFQLLGDWALADEARLRGALRDLQGDDSDALGPDGLARARRLFARALETPGGLRIQTIHSFCESVLRRFPLEAGVAPGFAVAEDSDAQRLQEVAIDRVAARENAASRAAIYRLSRDFNDDELRNLLLRELATPRREFRAAAAQGREGWARFGEDAAAALHIDPDTDERAVIAEGLAFLSQREIENALAVYAAADGNPKKFGEPPLRKYLAAGSDSERWAALTELFHTKEDTPRKQPSNEPLRAAAPWISEFFSRGQEWFIDVERRRRAAAFLADARAFYSLLEPAFAAYENAKAARAALDFSDLIDRTGRLFANEAAAAWVMYKLDQGLEHILLDEAQDTGRDAWETIEGPLKEFFAGKGGFDERRGERLSRTFFAVGDQKQSIYSFQGADAALFKEKSLSIGEKISAVARYENIPLTLSFRSTAPVLRFVDALFADDEVCDGVSDERPMLHGVCRAGHAGLVELWPLAARDERQTPAPWDAPLDASDAASPEARLTAEIAQTIRGWIDNGEKLESRDRPIRPGDVMILVQSRSRLFHEIIRSLSRLGVPVAGPDRTEIGDDPAVQDVFSYARAVLSRFDNLSLAETLKSPFFGFDDDDLYALAYGRNGSLWETLVAKADENPRYADVAAAIETARRVGLCEGPSAFIAHLLETGAPSGRARLAARLGAPSVEPIEELMRQAIALEAREPPSLQLFLDRLSRSATEISRDPDHAGDVVRVMTVHKAKGLEAPIVFLLDTQRLWPKKHLGPVYRVETLTAARRVTAPIVAKRKEQMSPEIRAARDAADRLAGAEHRRLLYVAATRAEDRLYICGVERAKSENGDAEVDARSWRVLAEAAFERLADEVTHAGERLGGPVRRIAAHQIVPAMSGRSAPSSGALSRPPAPAFLKAPLAAASEAQRKSATALAARTVEAVGRAYSPVRASAALLRGSALHRLLELLPETPAAVRSGAADRLLARMAPTIDEETRAAWRDEAMAVINAPAFAEAFGPGSQAEVAIAGDLEGAEGTVTVSGRIDRLYVDANRVLFIDYKTNQPPPLRVEETPEAFITQMAAYGALLGEIYQGRRIDAALLWTFEARLMTLPKDLLDTALKSTLA